MPWSLPFCFLFRSSFWETFFLDEAKCEAEPVKPTAVRLRQLWWRQGSARLSAGVFRSRWGTNGTDWVLDCYCAQPPGDSGRRTPGSGVWVWLSSSSPTLRYWEFGKIKY